MEMIARIKANALRRRNPFDRSVAIKNDRLKDELLRPVTEEQLAKIHAMVEVRDRREQRIKWITIAVLMAGAAALYLSI
jgi:hypothetical protein